MNKEFLFCFTPLNIYNGTTKGSLTRDSKATVTDKSINVHRCISIFQLRKALFIIVYTNNINLGALVNI